MDRVEERRWSGRGRGRYSSLSRKKVHVRKWSYARPHKGYGWFAGSNAWYEKLGYSGWSWRKFEPSHHKRFLLAILFIGLSVGFYAWAQDPANGLFHSYQSGSCVVQEVGTPCGDPTTNIWQRINAQPGTLVDFNLSPSQGQAYNTNCDLLGNGQDCIQLLAGSGNNSVAISKNPINDLAIALSKTMGIVNAFIMPSSGFATGGRGDASNTWGMFITRNNTAPAHNIGSSGRYSVFDDPNVVFAEQIYCVGGTCGGSGVSGTYNVLTYAQRQSGSVTDTLQSEDTTTCGGAAGSCIMAIPATSGISGCFTNPCTGNNIVNDNSVFFNYTGAATTNSVCSISSNVLLGAGCSWTCSAYGGTATLTLGSSCVGTNIIPPNPFGSGNFYFGVWSNLPSTAIEFEFAPGTVPVLGGTTGMEVTAFVPTPGGTSAPNIDTGGFFGPVIKALINIGVFILNALLAFISFITPALEAALSFLESIVRATLNLVGQAFGFPGSPGLGDDIFTFIGQLITLFTTQVPNAFGQIGAIFTGWINTLVIVFTTGVIGQIFSFLSSILTFGVNIVVFAFGVFTTGLSWTTIFVPFWLFIWFFGFNADDGMDGWIRWFDFAKWLAFDIGVKWVTMVINWAIDVTTAAMAILPKPFVQIAGRFPRIPILEIHGSFSAPSFDGQALREGNLFSILGMLGGFIGFVWYELTQSSIPGTLANEFMGQPFIQSATTAIVFYKLFLPMAVLTVFLLMIPTLFTSVFGVIVPGPSVGLPSLGSRPRRGVSIQGASGPLIRKREAGKRSSSFIKGRLEKIEGREKEAKKLRNQREEEARLAKQKQAEESVRRNEEAKKQSLEKERSRREASTRSDEAMFGQ